MQAIRTRYFGPSNTRGSRIQAKCEAKTIFVHYDDALNSSDNHKAACEQMLTLMGWTKDHGNYSNMVGGSFDHDWYWVFEHSADMGYVTELQARTLAGAA